MHKLTFKLKQHTPIIHFQHDQEGATLRASELKPKLDKFLIEKLCLTETVLIKDKSVVKPKREFESWFNNEEKLSLDYKVRVVSNGKEYILGFPRKKWVSTERQFTDFELDWDDQFPNYFGNMKKRGEEKKPKEFLFSIESIIGTLFCFNIELQAKIIEYFQEFFFKNNFGTRQNKGFGSFELIELNGRNIVLGNEYFRSFPNFRVDLSTITKDVKLYYKNNDIGLPRELSGKKNELKAKFKSLLNEKKYNSDDIPFLFKQHNLFYRIELYYKTLRSGINSPKKLYFKSFMFQYAKSLNPSQQWDKRTMRESFYLEDNNYKSVLAKRDESAETLKYTPSGDHEKDKLLFRDLLGLSSLQQWKYYYDDTITKKGVAVENGKEKVERFKSPITFKPILISEDVYQIFILTNESVNQILGESFLINSKKKKKNLELSIPTTFDINDYLRLCATDYIVNNNKSFEENFNDYVNDSKSDEANYLLSIYSQLNAFYNET